MYKKISRYPFWCFDRILRFNCKSLSHFIISPLYFICTVKKTSAFYDVDKWQIKVEKSTIAAQIEYQIREGFRGYFIQQT